MLPALLASPALRSIPSRFRFLLLIHAIALFAVATNAVAEPAPIYVSTWPPNGNEYPVVITGAGGHLFVGVQLFSTHGYVSEYDTDWNGIAAFEGLIEPPAGVAVDGDGAVYASFARCNCVQRLSDPVVTWGDTGSAPGEFNRIAEIAIDADGFLYAADRNNHRVQKLLLDGTPVDSWGDFGSGPGQLRTPFAIAVDGTGHVYVTDVANHKVQKYTTAGAFVTEWGDSGAAVGQFDQPTGIAADGQGHVFVADQNNQRIQKFTDSGLPLVSWGEPNSSAGLPRDVALDGQGGIFVVDPYNGVLKFQEAVPVAVHDAVRPPLAIEMVAPNPFRDHLAFRWTQPEAGTVQVTLADVSGRRVALLASGEWSAGHHELTLSPAVQGLTRLGAGIFWIRIRVAGRETARRVAFVR
jgi:streptogramin lyase